MTEAFEIHRRTWLFALLGAACLGLAGGFGWLAHDRSDVVLWAPAAVLLLLGLNLARAVKDVRTPVLVADDHGVRMIAERGWVGLLWSEMGEIRVERREGLRFDPRIKVVSLDGRRVYTSPLGISTNVSPGEAEVQLARRRVAAAY